MFRNFKDYIGSLLSLDPIQNKKLITPAYNKEDNPKYEKNPIERRNGCVKLAPKVHTHVYLCTQIRSRPEVYMLVFQDQYCVSSLKIASKTALMLTDVYQSKINNQSYLRTGRAGGFQCEMKYHLAEDIHGLFKR